MSKTKYTFEQVKEKFNERGYELLSTEYHSGTQKLEFICRKHTEYGVQIIDFNHFYKRGQGCKCCYKERINPRRTPDEEIIKLCNKNNYTFIKSEAINGKTVVFYVCNNHQEKGVQKTTISTLKNKKHIGCKYCLGLAKKTHDEFLIELYQINPNIEILSEYKSADDYIHCKCIVCGHEWETTPNMLLSSKTGCIMCGYKNLSKIKTKTNEQFLQEIKNHNPYIKPLEEYKQAKEKIKFECLRCGNIFYATPDNMLNAKWGCSICAAKHANDDRIKSNEQFVKELKLVNPNIIPLEPYKTDHEKIKVYCTIHNYTWMASPNKLLHRSTGCPKCNISNNEFKISQILDKWGYEYIMQFTFDDCKDKSPLPFDFYLPYFNIAIEYNGEQHYEPIECFGGYDGFLYITSHDKIKREYCKNNNIPLITIPYWENDNLECFLFDNFCKHKAIELIA